ncbi:ABC transporter substrate-binding protein [Helicobacter himalayensis]|uniref:ABC transporter substrate-binding protein n=1 Tax=Helicobacter himalayensis TaxID=1591088 RepID=UPI003D6E187B
MSFRAILLFVFMLSFVWAQNILKIATSSNAGVMNPQGYAHNQMWAQNMIYEGLVKTDYDGRIIPSLATSWKLENDAKTYVFMLREGVKFSNGEEFNAYAVKKNLDSVIKNAKRHSWSALSSKLESVEIRDNFTIAITLKSPYSATLEELSLIRPYRFVAPSEIPEDLDLINFNPKPIGTGPYMLTKSVLGVSDNFEKNPYYWNKDKYNGIYFDIIQTKIIIEPNAKLMALKTKQVDMIYGLDEIPIEIFSKVAQSGEFHTYLSEPTSTTSLVLNPNNPFLKDKNLRQAIAQAINKQALVKAVYGEYQEVASLLYAPNRPYANVSYQAPQFDKQAAVKLLESHQPNSGTESTNLSPQKTTSMRAQAKYNEAEAETSGIYSSAGDTSKGIESKKIQLELIYIGNNSSQKAMGEILQEQLKEIGIFLKLVPTEITIYKNKTTAGAFDMCFDGTWGTPYEPLMMLYSFKHYGHLGYAVLENLAQKEQIYKAIDSVVLDTSPATPAFGQKVAELLASVYDLNIYIPLTYQKNKAISIKELKGIKAGINPAEINFWEFYK